MSIENKKEVTEAVRALEGDEAQLRERVRALVMKALVDHQTDPAAIRDIMRDTLAGVGDGLMERGNQASGALKEAVVGLDEAVGRSVYAVQMAMEEAWGMGHKFAATDMKDTVEAVKNLEEDLLSTIKEASDKTQGWLKGEYADLGNHLARTGTDTGAQVRAVLETLNSRVSGVMAGSMAESAATAAAARERFSAVASGILRGLADALDSKRR
jgi:gas vesicle protein